MIPFDPVDVVLCVGNGFGVTTRDVAKALFDGDLRRTCYALQDCPGISMTGYMGEDGVYQNPMALVLGLDIYDGLWQIDAPNLPGWDDAAESAQDWKREDAAAWLTALKSHKVTA